MDVFENAKKIWCCEKFGEDEYAEFLQLIDFNGEKTVIRLSVCGDYTLYVNGKFVSSGQYGDFPHYKIYDELDITKYLLNGENTVAILAWYFGKTGMRYFTPTPGLIYEISRGDSVIAFSSENTLSRKSYAYKSGICKKITPQLDYSFTYDLNKVDDWEIGSANGFFKSTVFEKESEYFPRPIKKHRLYNAVSAVISKSDKGTYIAELPEEIVGLVTISFESDNEQKINVSYGEILENGHVKRFIPPMRDFSFDLIAKKGTNRFTNYMLRFACKYFEITSEKPLTDLRISLTPQVYPVTENGFDFLNGIDKDIYKICLNTLKLCMMEHYVDCPWREQGLYAFDSRNQMLAGYYAYADGNFDYARANLYLISRDRRPDGLLSICTPSARDLVIPSFSFWYIVAVNEYILHSGDISLGRDVFEKITDILSVFKNNMRDGLFVKLNQKNVWNFYDWSEYAQFEFCAKEQTPDALLNIIAVISLNAYAEICEKLGEKNIYEGLGESVAKRINEEFYDDEKGLYFVSQKGEYTELVNSLAICSGIVSGDRMKRIGKVILSNTLPPCSLSFKGFKFDAIIACDTKNTNYVFNEIRKIYKKMLDSGSTTVWETELGAADFDNAGSLCHGWSAVPIYYYNKHKDSVLSE